MFAEFAAPRAGGSPTGALRRALSDWLSLLILMLAAVLLLIGLLELTPLAHWIERHF